MKPLRRKGVSIEYLLIMCNNIKIHSKVATKGQRQQTRELVHETVGVDRVKILKGRVPLET